MSLDDLPEIHTIQNLYGANYHGIFLIDPTLLPDFATEEAMQENQGGYTICTLAFVPERYANMVLAAIEEFPEEGSFPARFERYSESFGWEFSRGYDEDPRNYFIIEEFN